MKTFEDIKKNNVISPLLSHLKEAFSDAKVYVVGGMVRDILLQKESHDLDLVIANVDAKELHTFLEQHGEVNLVGKKFGVFKFVQKKGMDAIDIALPRQDFALGTGKYTDVTIQTDPFLSIEEDLSRRDFTINAMAYDLLNDTLVDPYHGQEDLESKLIKTVGNPKDRFQEDYTRILRAIRFSCQLGFEIEKKTYSEMKHFISHINDEISGERIVALESIAKELNKAFTLSPVSAFDLCDDAHVFEYLMPEILEMKGCEQPPNFHSEGDVFEHTRIAMQQLNSTGYLKEFGNPASALTVFGVLFHDIGKPPTKKTPEKDGVDRIRFDGHDREGAKIAKAICKRLRLSSPDEYQVGADDMHFIVKHHLFLLSGPIEKLKHTTLEKYFFSEDVPGQELLQVIFCDAYATIPEGGAPDLTLYHQLQDRLSQLEALKKEEVHLPPALLDGDEIMKAFSLKPGKDVGKLKDLLREEQLAKRITTKEEALTFLKDHVT